MPRRSDASVRQYEYRCAWLVCKGVPVDDVALVTHTSRPSVYRALAAAKARKWLEDRPRLLLPPGPERDEYEDHIQDCSMAKEVLNSFAIEERPKEVIVVPSPPHTPATRLASAICSALRRSALYREHYLKEAPDWPALLPQFRKEMQSDPEVAGRLKDAPSEDLDHAIRKYLRQPYTSHDKQRGIRVGRAAADRFSQALDEDAARCVGIAWGYHVHAMVSELAMEFPPYWDLREDTANRAETSKRLQCFPLIGDLGLDPVQDAKEGGKECGANANCAELVRIVGSRKPPVFLTQSAQIPRRFGEGLDLRNAWDYVSADHSIVQIFGTTLADERVDVQGQPRPDPAEAYLQGDTTALQPKGYLAQASALVTGIGGAIAGESRMPRLGLVTHDELQRLQDVNCVGDICGCYFWDCGAPPSEGERAEIRRANRRMIVPRLADYLACTLRARQQKGALGTMVLASGRQRARALRALVRWRLVSTMVIDSTLAMELLGRVESEVS